MAHILFKQPSILWNFGSNQAEKKTIGIINWKTQRKVNVGGKQPEHRLGLKSAIGGQERANQARGSSHTNAFHGA